MLSSAARILRRSKKPEFKSTAQYWDYRYTDGGNSGSGASGVIGQFKADFLNEFVERNAVRSLIEFGCGDGQQLSLARYPRYTGVDVAPSAIALIQSKFSDKPEYDFFQVDALPAGTTADLSMSLDVIYHLIEDDVYETYMNRLFDAGERFVVIFSSNFDFNPPAEHVRHHEFTTWVRANRPEFELIEVKSNPTRADHNLLGRVNNSDFFVYQRRNTIGNR